MVQLYSPKLSYLKKWPFGWNTVKWDFCFVHPTGNPNKPKTQKQTHKHTKNTQLVVHKCELSQSQKADVFCLSNFI